ncbi:MAG: DUF711 family protein [Chloroflexi bacterium]|nr:DUF711 family protein [Chloroflexota bacterium]
MKIRSITSFISPTRVPEAGITPLGKFSRDAKSAFEDAGYEVQTTRLATTPFPRWIKPLTQSRAVEAAVAIEASAIEHGFGYVALGPALPELLESYTFIPDLLAATKDAFFSGVIADAKRGISMAAIRHSAEIIAKASTLEANGFANLRFAALAHVPPGSPFFPAAYHRGGKPAFAIATQAADLAVAAFTDARSIPEGSHRLSESIEAHTTKLAKVAEKFSRKHGINFGGIDFSLAPFPEENESLGTAFERMGIPKVGLQGSLAAAAILTQAIDAADFPRAGFCGLLLPPLEDSTLAKRAAEGTLTINDLLLFSAVCGTGLDTIPLPGNTTVEQISALLLDLSALALRLDKPLTARLMPIPGKQAGDETAFDFPYFANSRVMSMHAQALRSPFSETDNIQLKRR